MEQEQRARVAEAVGREEIELVGEPEGQLAAGGDGFDRGDLAEVVGAEALAGIAGERLGEAGDVGGAQLEPTSGAVTAVGHQAIGAGRHAGQQVEGRDAAPGAPGHTLGLAQQDRRPAGLLDDPRRDDADHAGVPVGRRQQTAAGQRLGQPGERLAQDDPLDLRTLGDQRAETLGQRQGGGAIGGAEQFDRLRGVFEAPRGVQAGREAKADGRGVDVVRPRLAHLEQRGQAGPWGAAQAADAHGGQAAVLVEQRHDVGDRADRDQPRHGRSASGSSTRSSRRSSSSA